MRERILKTLSRLHTEHPWRMFGVAVLITLILAGFSSQLTITMNMRDLLPEGDPKLDEFNRIIDEFQTATSLFVVVQGPEERIKEFADELAPIIMTLRDSSQNIRFTEEIRILQSRIDKLNEKEGKESNIQDLINQAEEFEARIDKKLFQRIDFKTETEFLRNHALMMVKAEDLENTKELFTDPNLTGLITNINNAMEKEYVGREESISTREKEDGAVAFLDGIENLILRLQTAAQENELSTAEIQNTADKILLGEPYLLSYDKTTLIMNAVPNFTIMDRDLLMVGTERVQEQVDLLLQNYPEVRAGLSGDIAREHDEQIHSTQSLGFTSLIAFAAILILLVISFRMWVAPILAGINLVVGLIWAMGAAYLAAGQLNMMTAMLSVVLLGLGIDFSIHMITGFTEWRAAGDSIGIALEKTFQKNGKGIITGALTTSCAFLALLISRSQGMKEMGLVTGAGLLSVMLATFLFLPVLLVLRERRIEKRQERKGIQKSERKDITFKSLGRISTWLGRRTILTIAASLILSAFLIWSAFQIQYDKNYMNMEPEGLASISLMDTITEKFDLSMEYALCLAESVEESRKLAESFKELGTVAMTNDISVYLPSEEEQSERIPYLLEIRNKMECAPLRSQVSPGDLAILKQEIERLEMNIMEMQDMAYLGGQDKVDEKCKRIVGDPLIPESKNMIQELLRKLDLKTAFMGLSRFQHLFAPYFKSTVLKMSSTESIQLEDLPKSVLEQYSNPSRNFFMVTIYPSGQLFINTDILERFVDDVNRVDVRTTGSPPVAIAWMKIAGRDGRNAILLTLIIIFVLLWIDFGKPGYAFIAMTPLVLGAFWMIGLMKLFGMMLNFMTLMGLPLIIGIGIDDGVHIMHRWQHEGKGKLFTVFSSTGKAILLTSLTTMLAFGSMTFSVFPAWAWFGESLFIGVGACFLTTVLVLSGILGLMERKNRKV